MPLFSAASRALFLSAAIAVAGPVLAHAASREKTSPAPAPAPTLEAVPLVLDESYAPLLEDSGGGLVLAACLLDDGRAVIGGTFEFIHDTAHRYFAGLAANGSIDSRFASAGGPDGPVHAIVALPDGAMLVGGAFRHFAGKFAAGLVRLRADGSVDPDFHHPDRANGAVAVIVLQKDGRIIVGGSFDQFAGNRVAGCVRLLPDGTVDETFQPDLAQPGRTTAVNAIAVRPDGTCAIVVTHDITNLAVLDPWTRPVDGVPEAMSSLILLKADGKVDSAFHRQRTTTLNPEKVFALPEGKLLLAGSGQLQRLHPDGSVDGRFLFKEQGALNVHVTRVLDDGRLIIGGSEHGNAMLTARLAVLSPNGRIDTRLVMPRDEYHAFHALASNGRGRLLVAGRVSPAAERLTLSKTDNRVLLLDENLAVDPGFRASVGGSGRITAAALDRRGLLTLAGSFKSNDGLTGTGLVRLQPDGSVDRGFRPNGQLYGLPHALVPMPDGGVIVGGIVNTQIDIKIPRPVLRLRGDGSIVPKFIPDLPLNGFFTDSAWLRDGTIVLVGSLAGRTPDRAFADLVRFDENGRVDRRLAETVPSWLASSSGRLVAVAETRAGLLLVGGEFSRLQNRPRFALARVGAEGVVDPAFTPQTEDFAVVASITVLADQRIFIDGWSRPTDDAPLVRRFARLLTDGARDPAFSPPDFGDRHPVMARALADGSVLVVLQDQDPAAEATLRLARLDPTGALMPEFNLALSTHGSPLLILPAADGSVYLAGDVITLAGAPRHGLARLRPRRPTDN